MIPALIASAILAAHPSPAPKPAPFAPGETFEYGGKYSLLPFLGNVGTGTLTVVGIDTAHGVPAWHFRLTAVVSSAIYKNHTLLESWTAVNPFESLRFVHQVNENGHQYADDDFQIWPDSGFYRDHRDSVTHATTPQPLDDLAFLYYIRMLNLAEGGVYHIPRYFHADKRVVTVTVVGRDWVDMPDGSRRRCWVIHPLVQGDSRGIFSERTNARVWISDDGVRIPTQLKFDVHPGSITLQLRKISHTP